MLNNKKPLTLCEKILSTHLTDGVLENEKEIGIRIDQTLTQDATGTMAYLEFEAMNIPSVKTELSVAYVDHNTLQNGFENADDHLFIQSAAEKYGLYYSRPGNGICHQVHLERFGVPGKTLVGSDSHTPTAGGLGMLAFGAGGLDVAAAMAGMPYYITMPKIIKVELTGVLPAHASAKDVSLKLLQILGVKGGVGYIIEWGGEGIKTLSVPERATITNMGTELGATSSIFPSDDRTREFLKAQGREKDYISIAADDNATYDRIIKINLSEIEPMVACPHSPDNVKSVDEIGEIKVDQVCIGSCTNSSIIDLERAASILDGRVASPGVSLTISPGSKQVLTMISQNGTLSKLLNSGSRILECACGPCIGMGMSPNSGGVSLRTFNRNFYGRSGTRDAKVYLVSPEVAAASAINGVLTNPKKYSDDLERAGRAIPENFTINDAFIIAPHSEEKRKSIELLRGPNIKGLPTAEKLGKKLRLEVSLKVEDNITTDHIMPAGGKILPFRSNIPKLSEFCFQVVDDAFSKRAKEMGNSCIIGGDNYGQGSSREHAALVPMYLGVRAVITKSFARIHKANLINFGILPLCFENPLDYEKVRNDSVVEIEITERNIIVKIDGEHIPVIYEFTDRQWDILKAGGLLNYIGNH